MAVLVRLLRLPSCVRITKRSDPILRSRRSCAICDGTIHRDDRELVTHAFESQGIYGLLDRLGGPEGREDSELIILAPLGSTQGP